MDIYFIEQLKRGWLTEHEIKNNGKGRPMKIYKLSVPIGEIIKHCEEVKNSESTQAMGSIQRLREMITT